MTLTG